MPFRIKADEPVEDAARRIALEQIDRAIGEISDKQLARDEAVHHVRKRCKKIRAVTRLVRPAFENQYEIENAFFRDAADELGGLRDAQVLLKTYDSVTKGDDRVDRRHFATVRGKLVERSKEVSRDTAAQNERLGKVRERFCEARERIAGWKLQADGFEAIEGGLLKTYARGRKTMRLAYEQSSVTAFHDWRKRVNYYRYHVRLLRNLWRPVFQSLRHEVEALADLLGTDHDLAVLRLALADKAAGFGSPQSLRPLLDAIDRKSAELRARARPLGERVYAEKPRHLAKRLRAYWAILRNEENCI